MSLKRRKRPLNLSEVLVEFGILKDQYPGDATILRAARLGQNLVREIQHLHDVLAYVRSGLPAKQQDHIDPERVETALARTTVRP